MKSELVKLKGWSDGGVILAAADKLVSIEEITDWVPRTLVRLVTASFSVRGEASDIAAQFEKARGNRDD